MRFFAFIATLFLLSCNDKKQTTDTTTVLPQTDTLPDLTKTPLADSVNAVLDKLQDHWALVTDETSGYTKEYLEYFVYTYRKTDPNYPYATRGDFNCDGRADLAVLVTDTTQVKLLFLYPDGTNQWWTENMMGAALKTMAKRDFGAMKDESEVRVSLQCDAVEAEWFESATQVIYFDGRKYQNVWTAD